MIFAEHPSTIVRAASRTVPTFFILDMSGQMFAQSADEDMVPFVRRLTELGDLRLLASGKTRLLVFDEKTILRLVPIRGSRERFFAVFVEHVKPRGALAAAIDRYKLTPRECEVLGLLARSLSNAEVAVRLSITENTVGDHVKSLLKKTRTKKRFDLLARMYGIDEAAASNDEAFGEAFTLAAELG